MNAEQRRQPANTAGEYHLTFDIDWAPDWSVREVLTILRDHARHATFFVTHDSEVLDDIRADGHVLGIHPNFHPNSTHGPTVTEIVAGLLRLVPTASVMRTHGLHQSSALFHEIVSAFPQINLDVSTLTYKFPHVAGFDWYLSGERLRRVNYDWEDDIAFGDPLFDWASYTPWGPRSIFDFHPIHVSLNSSAEHSYRGLKERHVGPLFTVEADMTLDSRSQVPGTRDFLLAVLASPANSVTLEEIACA